MSSASADLTSLSASALVDGMVAGDFGPVEVLDAHLAAIERINPTLNAIVTLAADDARRAASAAQDKRSRGDTLGPLFGLPIVVKDVTDTAGLRTTYGCMLYRDHVPDADAEVVARLRAAGAIILGKTNTPEFATGANTVNDLFGATLNPWNTELSPAGSSGGSAVAVATGMAALAHGTDFGCSLRMPAAFNGVIGLRTTPGLIPNHPMPLIFDAGQVHGPLARTAVDAALMLDAMSGTTPSSPISLAPEIADTYAHVSDAKDLRGMKLAYVADIAGIGIDDEIAAITRAAAMALSQAGATVEEIELDLSEGRDAYKILRGVWMIGQQYDRLDLSDKFEPNLRGNIEDGLTVTTREIAAAEKTRQAMYARTSQTLAHFDAILTPISPVPPYPVGSNYPERVGGKRLANYIDWIAPAFLITMLGYPAASAPAGLTGNKLPVGLQIVAPRLKEYRILTITKMLADIRRIGRPPIHA